METRTSLIKRKLEKEGWYMVRHGGGHDIYRHPLIKGIITLPRHSKLSPGVARSIAKKAGWVDK
jgi:predicted RNA binding protein YcfA (HicA-like mRNA interferase family)